jgi:hypothetical protein
MMLHLGKGYAEVSFLWLNGTAERTCIWRMLEANRKEFRMLSRRDQARILRAAYDDLVPDERVRWEFMFRDSRKFDCLDDRPRRHRGFNARCARRYFLKEGK